MTNFSRLCIFATVWGVLLGAPFVVGAASANAVSPPPTDGGPVEAYVGLYLVDIGTISEADNTFNAEFDVIGGWTDPRLAFDAEAEGKDKRIYIGPKSEEFRSSNWNAQVVAANAVGSLNLVSQKVIHHADGRIVIVARINVDLRADLDYRDFPFDSQVLPVHLESFAWNKNVLTIRPIDGQTGFDPSFTLPEWTVTGVHAKATEIKRTRTPEPFSRVTFEIELDRKAGFYVWKIFLPLFVIVSISWTTFWLNNEMLGRRLGVSVTGILTVIAYQFIVAGIIPRVSYLTALDKVALLSMLTIAATLVVSIVVDRVKGRNEVAAVRIDKACRVVFPAGYFGVIALVVFANL